MGVSRRLLACVLSAALAASLVPTAAFAEEHVEEQDASLETVAEVAEEIVEPDEAVMADDPQTEEPQVEEPQSEETLAEAYDGLPDGLVAQGDEEALYAANNENAGHIGWTASGLFTYIKNHTTPGTAEYEDAAYALQILNGTDSDEGLDVASSVNFADSNDPASLESMDKALSFIDAFNACRARENKAEGTSLSTNVGTNCIMLAVSIVQCAWSSTNYNHSQAYNVGENLAWGYADPFTGWYDNEKAVYKQAMASGVTPDYNSVGHYLNIVSPSYTVTGFAVSTVGYVCHEQSFSSGAPLVYTTSEFRSKWFDPYCKAKRREGMGVRFSDVAEGSWYYEVVRKAVGAGYLNGYDNGTFGPNDPLTRAQVVTVLWNMQGKPGASVGSKSFRDVANNQYYSSAVAWASSKGIVSGYGDGTFKPNKKVTRQELAAMICNYARFRGVSMRGSTSASYAGMSDAAKVSSYAQGSVGWCFANGILTGADGNINPQSTATRAQMAKMVVKLATLI